ncbi:MAG TPA: STAS domain-containing protein [Candidatus Baltobacteraceae bacterium]
MSHDELHIDIKPEGETTVFALSGSLDLATSPAVRAALVDAAGSGTHDMIVDLTNVDFLDSTGLGALIGAQRRALEQHGRMRVVVTDGPIARLLNITGLVRVFSVYHTLEAARQDRDRVVAPI